MRAMQWRVLLLRHCLEGATDCIFRREWAYSLNKQRQALCLRMLGLLWPGYFEAVCVRGLFFWVEHGASTLLRLLVDHYRSYAVHSICISHKGKSQRDRFKPSGSYCIFRIGLCLQYCCIGDIYICGAVGHSWNRLIQKASLICSVSLKEKVLHTKSEPYHNLTLLINPVKISYVTNTFLWEQVWVCPSLAVVPMS